MRVARVLYHLARADFLERVRRYSFLITLGLTIYLGYISAPPNRSKYITMQMSGHRALYNSAYMGTLVAMMSVLILSLAGFYVVRNALDRDLQTGVGEILATTPLTRPQYTIGKALSNLAVLAAMVGVVAISAGAMQLMRHEDTAIHPWRLLSPFLFLVLPVMAIVASAAILFETVSWLRGGLGNVIYFFLWIVALSVPNLGEDALTRSRLSDPLGFSLAVPGIASACEAAFPGCTGGHESFSMGFNFKGDGQLWDLTTFRWDGIHWTLGLVLGRLLWVGVALALALLAATFFQRFDPAREKWRMRPSRKKTAPAAAEESPEGQVEARALPVQLTPLDRSRPAGRARMAQLVNAELRLMLKGRSKWWYLVAAGLFVASFAVPVAEVRQVMAAVAWFWPVLIWSQMGAREARNGTEPLVFSCERALYRQLPAVWMAGVAVAMTTGGGFALRLLIGRDTHAPLAWLAAAIFIPSLALALGVWSGSSKMFEVLYTVWWYVGPMSHAPGLDFTSASPGSSAPIFYLLATGFLLALTYAGRRAKLGYA